MYRNCKLSTRTARRQFVSDDGPKHGTSEPVHEQQRTHNEIGKLDGENALSSFDALCQKKEQRSKLSQRRASFKYTGTLTENTVKSFLNGKPKAHKIHWHLLKDKALAGTVHKRLTSRVAVELHVETNNVRLLTRFQKA